MRKPLLLLGCGLVALVAIVVVNQTAQLVSLAQTVDPLLGRVVLFALLALYGLTLVVPVALLWRLPRPLGEVPAVDSPEHAAYVEAFRQRLARNPLLVGVSLEGRDGLSDGLRTLDKHAVDHIKKTAATVFVTTAVSQNGRLDAIMVLAIQAKLVWRLANLYQQRPGPRELLKLYGNVAATVFLASEIEDLDLSQQIQPVIQAALGGSVAGMVPGLAAISTIVLQSMLEGTANAYLTLRVGAICEQYCSGLSPFDAKRARRAASVTAAAMLGGIVSDSAGSVVSAIADAAKRAGTATVSRWNPFRAASAE